jgi:hypothetical protein
MGKANSAISLELNLAYQMPYDKNKKLSAKACAQKPKTSEEIPRSFYEAALAVIGQ